MVYFDIYDNILLIKDKSNKETSLTFADGDYSMGG